jgi:hypothetical protein
MWVGHSAAYSADNLVVEKVETMVASSVVVRAEMMGGCAVQNSRWREEKGGQDAWKEEE